MTTAQKAELTTIHDAELVLNALRAPIGEYHERYTLAIKYLRLLLTNRKLQVVKHG